MTARLEVAAVTPPDPNATPRTDIVDGPNGGVIVDPSKTPAPADKSKGERPAGLPDKFNSWEDLAKSYTELEKKIGTPSTPAAAPVTPEAAAKAGIDLPALNKEFAEKGELSAETLAALDKAGFNKAAVDSYVAGQTAIAEKITADLQAVAGGKEQFAATLAWATANLSAEDVAAYNDAIDSGNVKLAKLALAGVVAQYNEANGTQPNLIAGGESARGSDAAPYESQAQIIADMSKPEYKNDPAFRAKVTKRLAATNAPYSR